jgi:anti-sigma regulatory factor (Ser/Thr protein kinase)
MGLIVNELVTNALKYAFPSETKGTVMVTLKRVPGEFRLTAAHDGKRDRSATRRLRAGWPAGRGALPYSSAARSSGKPAASVRPYD